MACQTPKNPNDKPPLVRQVQATLMELADPDKAIFLQGFFKTGPGEYGEGDRFLGITVPAIRKLAKQFKQLTLSELEQLLHSVYNEQRLLALVGIVELYQRSDAQIQQSVCDCYLKNRDRVNNWNLVDASAPYILGAHLLDRDRAILNELSDATSLWDRRIAIVSTYAFIRAGQFTDTLRLTEKLLNDGQDLMHKACGWMLREVGKRDQALLEKFLNEHAPNMPRTMLRYAIEKFAPEVRKHYLARS